jgi:hypothetical protein
MGVTSLVSDRPKFELNVSRDHSIFSYVRREAVKIKIFLFFVSDPGLQIEVAEDTGEHKIRVKFVLHSMWKVK